MLPLHHLSLYENNASSSKLVKVMFSGPDCFLLVLCIIPMQRQAGTVGVWNTEGWKGKLSTLKENLPKMIPSIQ